MFELAFVGKSVGNILMMLGVYTNPKHEPSWTEVLVKETIETWV